jgi:hypothetical protein
VNSQQEKLDAPWLLGRDLPIAQTGGRDIREQGKPERNAVLSVEENRHCPLLVMSETIRA